MKPEDAEEYTQALGQVVAGGWRQIALGERLGVPKALKLSVDEWVKQRLGGYVRLSVAERQEAAVELKKDGRSTREIGAVLGVDHETVRQDLLAGEHSPAAKVNGRKDSKESLASGEHSPPDVMSTLVDAPADEPRVRLAVHFSSESPEHYTPVEVLTAVRAVFGDMPDLDPCSNSTAIPHVEARAHYTAADDGLSQPWCGRVFVNPPYGREIAAWVDKMRSEWQRREVTELIALLPARTDTAWFNTLTSDTDDAVICLLSGRLTFVGNTDPAPFPSMVVYFGPRHDVFARVFAHEGSLWQRPSRPLEWFVNHEADGRA